MLHAKKICMPRWRFGVVAAAAALLLGACGHNDHDDNSMAPGSSQTTPPPVSTVDAFIAYVQSVVASMSDTAEPVAIDAVAVTTPENTEPVAVN